MEGDDAAGTLIRVAVAGAVDMRSETAALPLSLTAVALSCP